jgi:general secretion pathway protein K
MRPPSYGARRHRPKQRGAAVLVAMLVVALAATAASFMLQRQDASIRRFEAAQDYEQARWILRGGVQWARAILAQDARSSTVDHAAEPWATGLPPTRVERVTLSGEIRDVQGLYNLNNVVRDGKRSERDVAILKRLLAAIGLRTALADAIADWIDADSDVQATGGAEDDDYMRLPSPYRAANRPMADIAELYRVRGFDAEAVARLRRVATVLPQRTIVNVNFAPPEVLVALIDGLSLAEALVLASARASQPFADRDDFRARLPRESLRGSDAEYAVRSDFFLVLGRARFGRADVYLQALLKRAGGALPAIVWQRMS